MGGVFSSFAVVEASFRASSRPASSTPHSPETNFRVISFLHLSISLFALTTVAETVEASNPLRKRSATASFNFLPSCTASSFTSLMSSLGKSSVVFMQPFYWNTSLLAIGSHAEQSKENLSLEGSPHRMRRRQIIQPLVERAGRGDGFEVFEGLAEVGRIPADQGVKAIVQMFGQGIGGWAVEAIAVQ